jgi:hypothetical protein
MLKYYILELTGIFGLVTRASTRVVLYHFWASFTCTLKIHSYTLDSLCIAMYLYIREITSYKNGDSHLVNFSLFVV